MSDSHHGNQQIDPTDGAEQAPPREWRRRALLGAAAAAGVAVVGGGVWRVAAHTPAQASEAGLPAPVAAPTGAWSGSFLQIIAHPDDDLYFMNPSISQAIAAGAPVVTAVLAAGENDGRNIESDATNRDIVPVDYAGYSEARHNGLRAAYALMATGDRTSPWQREAVRLADGALVERNTLTAKPQIQLYFFNICQSVPGQVTADQPEVSAGLSELWSAVTPLQPTLVTADSPVRAPQTFSRDGLVACLVALLQQHRPTVVRTLDPDPEHDAAKTDIVASDHPDHAATARFALQALHDYQVASGQTPVVEHYRGFANQFWPSNLADAALQDKAKVLSTYAGADGFACPTHNCGDYQLGSDLYRRPYLLSTVDRYSPSTTWLSRRGDGSLIAFVVLGGRVAYWTEAGPGSGRWSGPRFIGGDGMMPALAVAVGPHNRVHVVGLRRTETGNGAVTVDVVHSAQDQPGRSFSGWESLDGPDAADPDRRRQREVGVPAATVDASGRLCVFVRNFGFGLSMRSQRPGGGWRPWQDLHGRALQDAPTALTTSTGRVEVFAPGRTSMLRWYQAKPGGPFTEDTHLRSKSVAPGGVTAVESSPDRITLYYRLAKTAEVLASTQPDSGEWSSAKPIYLGGVGGTGPVAAVQQPSSDVELALLAYRNGDGTASVGARSAGRAVWTSAAGALVQAPALAVDHAGHAVLAVVGVDGRLHVARQQRPVPGSGFGPWTAV